MKKPGRAMVVSAGALAVIVAIGAVAQTPRPRYVDETDNDRQPYFVDGVEYRPYVPVQPSAGAQPAQPAAASPSVPAGPAAAPGAQAPVSQTAAPGQLRPFVPAQSASAPEAAIASEMASVSASASQSQRASSSASEEKAPVVAQRPRYGSAVIEVLDKVTAESVRFEAPIGKPLRYKSLVYTVRACETSAEDEAMQDVFAYIQIRTAPDQPQGPSLLGKSREVFRGWSFASSPSLNPVQHPNYDAWVVGCRNPLPA